MTVRLAGSLWSVPREQQESEARRLALAGLPRWHWDVSDGDFASAGGFTPADAARIGNLTRLPGEAHLMVSDPLSMVESWIEQCDTVVVHIESTTWARAVEVILSAGRTAAVAVNPDTSVNALTELPRDIGILVMSISPGRAGTPFRRAALGRLEHLAGRALLGVDGSVDLERGHSCVRHGATWLVSGTALTQTRDPHAWIASATSLGVPRVNPPDPTRRRGGVRRGGVDATD